MLQWLRVLSPHTESTYQQHGGGLVLLAGRIYSSQRHANLRGLGARPQGLPGRTHACWVPVRDFRRCRSVFQPCVQIFQQAVGSVSLYETPQGVQVVILWCCFLGLLSEIPDPDLFLQDLLNSLPWWINLETHPLLTWNHPANKCWVTYQQFDTAYKYLDSSHPPPLSPMLHLRFNQKQKQCVV